MLFKIIGLFADFYPTTTTICAVTFKQLTLGLKCGGLSNDLGDVPRRCRLCADD